MNGLTPLHLEMLIHYNAFTEPFPRENSVIVNTRAELIRLGLVEPNGPNRFDITEKGTVFVEMLCRTPLPIEKKIWIDPTKITAKAADL